MPWLLKKLLRSLKKQPLKLLLQTKLLHQLKKLLPSKLATTEIPSGELEKGQPGNRLTLFLYFFETREPIDGRRVDGTEEPFSLLPIDEGLICVN
ncbi:hypothetical protein SPHINGOR109_10329 [Sphingorhabdus sp. 109]|nr:hypothetical protein SPHINGOR109_10329 [Sphingorhabdus sp. 109]